MTRSIPLTTTKQMRALAHPLRLRLLGELRVLGPRTVGQLAEIVGEAPGTVSYHMATLAEFGFVEPAAALAVDRRERWWQAAHDFTAIEPVTQGASDDEKLAAAAVRHQIVDAYAQTLHRSIEQDPSGDWAAAGTSSDVFAFLTVDELAEASAELRAVVRKWYERGGEARVGAEATQLIVHAFRKPA